MIRTTEDCEKEREKKKILKKKKMLFSLLRNRSISRITFDPLCISIELYSKYSIHARASLARSRGLPSELSGRAREEEEKGESERE